MRTLNRPLFKMGGSIKEGVMHGIREPKRNGGLSKQFNTGLVGDERYPKTDGREHHVLFLPALGAAGMAALRFAAPYGARLLGGAIRTGVGGKRFLAPTGSWWGKDPLVGGARKLVQSGLRGKSKGMWGKVGKFATAPTTALGAAYALTDIFPGGKPFGPDTKLPNILGQRFDEKGKKIPGTGLFNPGKPKKEGYILPGQGLSGEKVTKDTSTAAERKAFADKQKDARLAKYLDMMGYDKARKNAVADAMIDAGRIINERGTLKGKNINRELIDPIIGATSARLDKPEQIREAVGLMMTKTDLEKEAAGGKPGPALKAARDYQEQFGGTLQDAYKHTGGTKQLNFGETKSALAKQYGRGPNDQDVILQTIQLVKGNEPGFKLDDIKVLGDAETLEGLEKQEDFISITDSVLKSPDAQTEDGVVKPGIYVVGHAVVVVTEDGKVDRIN